MEEAEKCLSDLKKDVRDIRRKQNMVFIEVLMLGLENALGYAQAELSYVLGIAGIGVAIGGIGLANKDVTMKYLGMIVLSIAIGLAVLRHFRMRGLKESAKRTYKLMEALAKEVDDSSEDTL